ncbi:MAG: GAF domain-containing protein [Bacteroidaceae bacterium]|nr:GAF domain-containing protein [Bacteroidaceae bacterium]
MKDKESTYRTLAAQVKALCAGEDYPVSVMANVAAAIYEATGAWWAGFYVWRGDALRLGPFQGPVACTRIEAGRGVCGTAYAKRQTIVVPDVEQFPGHIACSSRSRSEIVVPIFDNDGSVKAVLDLDSDRLAAFDDTDARHLEHIAALIAPHI